MAFLFLFFGCCCYRRHGRGGDRERNVQREREKKRERWAVERERVSCIKYFGFRNKYGMY